MEVARQLRMHQVQARLVAATDDLLRRLVNAKE
jgi:hypothetical protein